MPTSSVIQRSFAGGELAPVLHARADLAKYRTGARTCRNFVIRREGGVENRAGFRYVATCKTNSADVMLLRYVSETAGQSVLIEAGVAYLRFYRNGGPVTVSGVPAWSGATAYVVGDLVVEGGVHYYAKTAHTNQQPPNVTYWHALTGTIYEIPTPYGAELFNWVQSGTIITLTHPTHPPRELVFQSLTRWIIRDITTAPTIAVPTGVSATVGAAGTLTTAYKVTATAADTEEESVGSSAYSLANHAAQTVAAPNVVTWNAVTGASSYDIYADPYANGVFGWIGTATGILSFRDVGKAPDFNLTPPIARTLFAGANTYPSYAAYYQQRRFFANTINEPDGLWGSRTGLPSNFGISTPLQDDDAITFRLAGNNQHPVRGLVGLKNLIVLTDGGEWTITGGGGPRSPLTPSSIDAEQETYAGIAAIPPVIVGNAILYVQARGTVLRDLRFDQQVEGLAGRDLTVYAAHLFDGYSILDIDFQQVPHSVIWIARSDGTLLGLTYIREEEVWGWHRHDTYNGTFEDVCVVPETDEDGLYTIVKRTIGGATVRYIERLESRIIRAGFFDVDAFFVDSGLSYSGAPATAMTGLAHLNGQVVAVVGDGDVIFNGDPASASAATYTVAAGAITLPAAKSNVHIGLPIRYGDLETLDLDVDGSDLRDKAKRVGGVTILVERSARAFWAGPDSATLTQYTRESWEAAADETTGQLALNLTSTFGPYGRVLIRQTEPLPLTILGVIPNVEAGG